MKYQNVIFLLQISGRNIWTNWRSTNQIIFICNLYLIWFLYCRIRLVCSNKYICIWKQPGVIIWWVRLNIHSEDRITALTMERIWKPIWGLKPGWFWIPAHEKIRSPRSCRRNVLPLDINVINLHNKKSAIYLIYIQ